MAGKISSLSLGLASFDSRNIRQGDWTGSSTSWLIPGVPNVERSRNHNRRNGRSTDFGQSDLEGRVSLSGRRVFDAEAVDAEGLDDQEVDHSQDACEVRRRQPVLPVQHQDQKGTG
jgi:hypothetical protein